MSQNLRKNRPFAVKGSQHEEIWKLLNCEKYDLTGQGIVEMLTKVKSSRLFLSRKTVTMYARQTYQIKDVSQDK